MNILVLDDEAEIADLVELFLKNEGYNVYKFYSSSEANALIQHRLIWHFLTLCFPIQTALPYFAQ